MWQLNGNLDYICNSCNSSYSIPSDWFSLEATYGSDRRMGQETHYTANVAVECTECEEILDIELNVIEYPAGVLNQFYVRSDEITVTQMIDIEIIDESPIWLPPAKEIIVPETRIITDLSEIHQAIPRLIRLIQEDSSYIYKISTREFEEIIAEIFRSHGYEVTLTKRTRDGGKDIIAIHRNELGLETSYFIECKRHAFDSKVDVGIVREVYGVHSSLNGPNKSIIATTSTFTPDALKFAGNDLRSRWDMALKDINDVLSWIRSYKM